MPAEKFIYQLTVRTSMYVLSIGAVLLGAALGWGGPSRFATPSLATARIVPGGPYTWGALIAVGGAIALVGAVSGRHRDIVMIGIAWQGSWYLFFDVALWTTAAQDPQTPLMGCFVYAMLAVICGVLYAGGHRLMLTIGGKGL